MLIERAASKSVEGSVGKLKVVRCLSIYSLIALISLSALASYGQSLKDAFRVPSEVVNGIYVSGVTYDMPIEVVSFIGIRPQGTAQLFIEAVGTFSCTQTAIVPDDTIWRGTCRWKSDYWMAQTTFHVVFTPSDGIHSVADSGFNAQIFGQTNISIGAIAPSPATVGQAYTVPVVVNVIPPLDWTGPLPGIVNITDGATSCAVTLGEPIPPNNWMYPVGVGSCVLISSTAGNKTITANYLGGGGLLYRSSTAMPQTVNALTTTTSIGTISPSPATVGQSYTVPVTVASGSGTPTGAVTVTDGSASCTVTLVSGVGSCVLTSSTAGAKTITASYGGDATYASSTGTKGQAVNAPTNVPTTTSIGTISPSPATVGQSYTVPVTVASGSGTPTGAVTVTDGSASCTVTLVSGVGSCVLTSSTAGAKTITASYGGDATYASSTGTKGQAVNAPTNVPTTTSIGTISPSPATVGQSYTVPVTVASGSGTPTGAVTVTDGSASCTVTLVSGVGSCVLTSSTAGAKTITASYGGDATYASSTGTKGQAVNAPTNVPTTTSIGTISPSPATVGQSYTVPVTVASGSGTPTGAVTVTDGSASCTVTLVSGVGSCVLTSSTAGAKTITASYGGDATYASSTGTKGQAVNAPTNVPTTTSIGTISPSPATVGQSYAVPVTVTSGSGTPTGTVTITDGSATCTVTLASGAGACALTSSTAGAKMITASYGGDATFAPSSGTKSQTVNAPTTTPSISAGGVVGLNNTVNTIQPGAWITIFGSNLATSTYLWNGDYPTTLGGTSVTINGKPAYLWFASPRQINLQAPDDDARGLVGVVVTTPNGVAVSTVTLAGVSPSFNLLDDRHIAGIILRSDGKGAYGGGGYDIIGPTGTSLGYPTVAAKAGDSVLLYGVGFGPTTPVVPAGAAFYGAAPMRSLVQFTINGRIITPDWAGLSASGLFQFNLKIPAGLGTGDVPVQGLVNGINTPTRVVISLQ